MASDNPMIWLDLTMTLNWHRPAVGMVRCEQECARWLAVTHPECTRFCVYDGPTKTFVELQKETVEQLLNGRPHAPEPAPSAPVCFSDRLKVAAKPYVKRLPFKLQQKLRACYTFTKDSVQLVRRYVRADKHRPPSDESSRGLSPSSLQRAQFGSSNIHISFGQDWDRKDMVELYCMKQQCGFKVILMCYDIVPVKFPQFAVEPTMGQTFAKYLTDVAWCADHVFCISQHTMRDLEGFLRSVAAPVPSLNVVTLGSEIVAPDSGESSDAFPELSEKRFILYVSTIEARKNHEILYRSYVRLVESGKNDIPILVFVGMQGWYTSELVHFVKHDPLVKDLILVYDNVSDSKLAWLYENAYFTVYPSLYEGWGLPVAESLAHGKFCLASSTSSLPEVGGNLVDYLDPFDLLAWTERLGYYFDNPVEVEKRNEIIRSMYRPASWETMAEMVYGAALDLWRQHSPSEIMPAELIKYDSDRVIFQNWSYPEPGHRWSLGHAAAIMFAVSPKCSFTGKLMLHVATHGRQTLIASLNSVELGREVVDSPDTEVEFTFDPRTLHHNKNNQLAFSFPDARKPDKDDRILAMALRSLEFL